MSTRFRGWLVVVGIGVAAAGFGCGPHKRGTIPVDSPIYQAPNDDPSAEDAEEADEAKPEAKDDGTSSAKPASAPKGKGSKEVSSPVRH